MSYRDWYVGMKVVCVDNSEQEENLAVGRVYTIAAITVGFLGKVYVALAEFPETCLWWPKRFRPVEPRKTDISIFTAMLTTPKVPA
jgi:hypothetical protein